MPRVTRLAFVDDHPMFLLGLRHLFARSSGLEVVATGSSADDALTIVQRDQPEVMFVDLCIPGDAFATIAHICRRFPDVRVIVFLAGSGVETALPAIAAGAVGLLHKSSSVPNLHEAIDAVLDNEMYLPTEYVDAIMSSMRNPAIPAALAALAATVACKGDTATVKQRRRTTRVS